MVIESWTIRKLLEWTSGFFSRKEVDSPRLSAELLLAHVLAVPRIKLYTDYERPLGEKELATFRDLVKRAGEQEPIAYLTGKSYFFNLELAVGPGVLIPRPDTETLVENVLQLIRNTPGMDSPRVLDLCTGSGCIACAIASRVKTASVTAIDLSETAVAIAQKNAEQLKVADRVVVLQGDLYAPLTDTVDAQPFHLIVSNPPYIPSGQIESLDRNVRDYEPHLALDGGPDGLVIHRRILEQAAYRLLPGGHIFMEIAFDQGHCAMELMSAQPDLQNARLLKDYGGKDRVVTATRKS
jgi:release factor glutamine methyltransferase